MVIETELRAPAFLIAVPQLGDPNFNRGVVFMLEHNDQGTMGLVINRPTELSMGEYGGDRVAAVHQGGPVQMERAFILHDSEHRGPETEDVLGGVRLSYSLESLRLLVERPPERWRVFLGYAGWGPNQLAEEISAGAWLVGPPSLDLLYETPPDLVWERALRLMGIEPAQLLHSGAVH
jgi:putative transcriptional regulator